MGLFDFIGKSKREKEDAEERDPYEAKALDDIDHYSVYEWLKNAVASK